MTKATLIGIWMDHSEAHLMEYSNEDMVTNIIKSRFTQEVKEESISKGESGMNTKEKQLKNEYYKELAKILRNYEGVLLFGPTTAKTELVNILKEDHHFDKLKIDVQSSFKMTENQQHAYVKEYFSKQYIY
jgi:sigma54-dependent transcription regulator